MSDDNDQFITVEEAAQILGLSTRQVHRYGKGDCPRIRTRYDGRRFLYHQGDVEALSRDLVAARMPPLPPPPRIDPPPKPPSPLLPKLGDRPDPLTIGELISMSEAAAYAGLSRDTLHNYARRGRIRAKKIGGWQWLTTYAAIDEYLASRKTKYSPRKTLPPSKN